MAYVYIVRCRDGSYYTSSTEKDPESRVWEHNNDEDLAARFTIKRRPVVLVFAEHFDRVDTAFAREKQIQGWSRAKKEALINGALEALPELSRRGSRRFDRLSDRGGGSAIGVVAERPG